MNDQDNASRHIHYLLKAIEGDFKDHGNSTFLILKESISNRNYSKALDNAVQLSTINDRSEIQECVTKLWKLLIKQVDLIKYVAEVKYTPKDSQSTQLYFEIFSICLDILSVDPLLKKVEDIAFNMFANLYTENVGDYIRKYDIFAREKTCGLYLKCLYYFRIYQILQYDGTSFYSKEFVQVISLAEIEYDKGNFSRCLNLLEAIAYRSSRYAIALFALAENKMNSNSDINNQNRQGLDDVESYSGDLTKLLIQHEALLLSKENCIRNLCIPISASFPCPEDIWKEKIEVEIVISETERLSNEILKLVSSYKTKFFKASKEDVLSILFYHFVTRDQWV